MLAFNLFVFSAYLSIVNCANILSVFPHVGKSHFFMFEPYIQKLASRGHHVTLVSHFPPASPSPNIQHISLRGSVDGVWFNALSLEELGINTTPPSLHTIGSVYVLNEIGKEACRAGYTNGKLLEFVREKPKVDLVIVEFFNTDCFAALSYYFDAPLIGMFSSYTMPWHNDRFGNPDNPSYIPHHFLQHSQNMNYLERLKNTAVLYTTKIVYRFMFDPPGHDIAERALGIDLPPLHNIVANSSLFLLNTHFSLFQPRPLVPGIIEVAGLHIKEPGTLPEDLKKYLDRSVNGVVYFSLGSTILGCTIGENRRKMITNVFAKLSLNVLWKWECDEFEDKPENVRLAKWLPQNEILAHPNVKVFITHGGLMGTEEAVHHGVPMLFLPIYGDQPVNAAAVQDKGAGIIVNYYYLTEESLSNALQALIQDPSYKENARLLSKTFRDRPMSIMDTAIYWTEYVLKYNGAPHIRSSARNLHWYQEYLLDVVPVLVLILALIILLVVKMYIACFRFILCRNKQHNLTIDKKNK